MRGARNAEGEAASRRIGGLVGPALMALIASEYPLVQPHLYDEQIPPVVYLSGTLMFIAGVAIVRAHNRWARNWAVLITIVGWLSVGLGLIRMFFAGQYRATSAGTSPSVLMVVEGVLMLVGLVITVQSYRRRR
jgi:hypothetical protein